MDTGTDVTAESPPSQEGIDQLAGQLRDQVEAIIRFAEDYPSSLRAFEHTLWALVCVVYRLAVALFLANRHQRLDVSGWLDKWKIERLFAKRTLKTLCGEVTFGRVYLRPLRGKGNGWHPLDAALAITADGFSWRVIEIATRLATRVSYAASQTLMKAMLGWAPSTEAIESLAIGLGSRAAAFMQTQGLFEDDGEVLVIEVDGKAIPTATEAEMKARRGPRKKSKKCGCGSKKCQRHRGGKKRKKKCCKKRKKRGHNSKNGKSATLVAMYTLQRGDDGKLHGPINKKIWGRFGSRHDAIRWARQQAERRGFGPGTDKVVQIVLDGEKCLRKRFEEQFPKTDYPQRVITLDVCHAQERLWKLGRLFHKEGSDELAAWVEPLQTLLLSGRIKTLLKRLRTIYESIPLHGPNTKSKREGLEKQIAYLDEREPIMHYDEYKCADLVLATGVIEGACRYVIGERLDCSGMRWGLPGAEPLLQLRCIELNGDWNAFIDWAEGTYQTEQFEQKPVQIRYKEQKQKPNNSVTTQSTVT
ncbi:MAG: hypothetical protein IH991_24340 [Planctomycetes bacterium]|nr:hypothetical protein [Planctomycetota bacterium]